jgi:uncharacterized membrane protein
MNIATLTWFTIGACLVYAVAVDENVFPWLVLQSKLVKVWAERQWFRVRYHPDSPWVRFEIKRNADKLAREIIKEIKNR